MLQSKIKEPKNLALKQRLNQIWAHISRARDQGLELSPLIAQIFEIELKSTQDAFESKTQQVATLFLIPLYLFFLPAAMLPIFGPVLSSLSGHFF